MNDVEELQRGITAARTNGDTRTLERLQAEARKLPTTRVSSPASIQIIERSQLSVVADPDPAGDDTTVVTRDTGTTVRTVLVSSWARDTVRNMGLTPSRESGAWLVGHQDGDTLVIETVWTGRAGSDGFEGDDRNTYRFDAEQLARVDEKAMGAGWRVIGDLHSHPQADAGYPSGADEFGWMGQAKGLRQDYLGVILCPHFADMLETSDQFRRPQWSGYITTPDGTIKPVPLEFELSAEGD